MVGIPDIENIDDEGLMTLIQKGDHEAFTLLVKRYTRMFYAAAYRMCSDQDMAEDIVQDAFLKLWNNPDLWDSARGAKFSTWFYRVVTNQAIDTMRKIKNTKGSDVLERMSDDRDSQHDVLEDAEEQAIMEEVIQTLPERQKIALNLCFYEGLSNKEAAEILGVGVKGLESLLMRAKAGLRDELMRRGILAGENGVRYG